MPNPIKYNTSTEPNSLNKGDFWIGTNDADKGPTGTTGFWNGISPPPGGYTVYSNKASNGPSIRVASDDAKLISVTNKLAGTSYTTVNECFNYFAGQDDKMVFNQVLDFRITDGLVLDVDPKNIPSYPRNGTTWYDLSKNNLNGTLTNNPTWNQGGYFVSDATDDYIRFGNPSELNFTGSMSHEIWFWRDSNATSNLRLTSKAAGGGSTGQQGFSFFGSDSGITWSVNVDGNRTNLSSTITTGKWYHIIGTANLDNGEQKVYLNGVETNSGALGGSITMAGNVDFFIGSYFDPGNLLAWDGKIGSTRIYNKPLSESEVKQNYYKGNIVTDGLLFAVDGSNLVSYEDGSSTTYSLTGSNDGTLTNGVSFSDENGGVLYFDGSNDYIEFTDNYIGNGLTISSAQGYTLEAWIKVETSSGTTTSAATIVGQTSSTGYGFQVGVSSGKPRINYGARSTSNFYSSTFEYNEWIHVTLVKLPNAGCRGFLNGVVDTTFGSSLTLSSPSDGALRLGNASPRVSGYFDGAIGPVRIYNRDLSDGEVKQNYNAQKSKFL